MSAIKESGAEESSLNLDCGVPHNRNRGHAIATAGDRQDSQLKKKKNEIMVYWPNAVFYSNYFLLASSTHKFFVISSFLFID